MIPELDTKLCDDCKEPAYVGSRCFRCYVRRLARDRGLLKYRWFRHWFEKFTLTVKSRYSLVLLGEQPPDVNGLMEQVWTDDPRPYWKYRKRHERVIKLVETIEKRAREERDEANRSSQENRG